MGVNGQHLDKQSSGGTKLFQSPSVELHIKQVMRFRDHHIHMFAKSTVKSHDQ